MLGCGLVRGNNAFIPALIAPGPAAEAALMFLYDLHILMYAAMFDLECSLGGHVTAFLSLVDDD